MKVKSFVTAVGLTLALSLGLGTTSAMAAKGQLKQNCSFCAEFKKKDAMKKRCMRLNNLTDNDLKPRQQRFLEKCNRCSSKGFIKICKRNNLF